MISDTIVAISTALQEGAISIVRMSGDKAIEIGNEIFTGNLLDAKSHTIHYGMIVDGEEEIDEVLINVFRAPKTYTREDIIEINCHGGTYVTKKILSLCISKGAKIARPGEFTERAFLNGRIDLSQAEGVNDLINATNRGNAKSALHSLKGSVTRLINPLCEDLLNIIAQIEVNIDYPEYQDIEQLSQEVVYPMAVEWDKKIQEIIEKAQNSILIKKGIDTVILGKPNVGKSSLLNALLEEDKAIVTDIAGTTRDLVEGNVRVGNVTLNLIDTAGIRSTEDIIEKIGIEKSIQALEEAELVLVVLDANEVVDEEDKKLLDMTKDKNRIVVYNKDDEKKCDETCVGISAKNKDIEKLKEAINEKFSKNIQANQEDTLNNERQIGLAMQAHTYMTQVIHALENQVELDLVTIDLQSAYSSLKEILGETSREDLLDALFSNFCLGK